MTQAISSGLRRRAEIRPGSVITIKGPCGSGATTIGMTLAVDAARRGRRVVYFNLDTKIEEFIKRLFANIGEAMDCPDAVEKLNAIGDFNIITNAHSVAAIKNEIDEFAKVEAPHLVVIDTIHLVVPSGDSDDVSKEIREMVRYQPYAVLILEESRTVYQ